MLRAPPKLFDQTTLFQVGTGRQARGPPNPSLWMGGTRLGPGPRPRPRACLVRCAPCAHTFPPACVPPHTTSLDLLLHRRARRVRWSHTSSSCASPVPPLWPPCRAPPVAPLFHMHSPVLLRCPTGGPGGLIPQAAGHQARVPGAPRLCGWDTQRLAPTRPAPAVARRLLAAHALAWPAARFRPLRCGPAVWPSVAKPLRCWAPLHSCCAPSVWPEVLCRDVVTLALLLLCPGPA